MIPRRRFMTIAAAAAAFPAVQARAAGVREWTGVAMGSAARIILRGVTPAQAHRLFRRIEAEVAAIESQLSLHCDSELTRLNRDGRLSWPAPEMRGLFALAGRVHAATGGAFDPTVQPLWLARATGGDEAAAAGLIGWADVRVATDEIRLGRPGMALTFNGIAQGHAADRIAALMRSEGLHDVMIDMGEVMAMGQRPGGGAWRAEIDLPDGGEVTRTGLSDRALATSAPLGTRIGPEGASGHILNPKGGAPLWQLVSVAAPHAALADALSTAFCLMDRPAIDHALSVFAGASLVALV